MDQLEKIQLILQEKITMCQLESEDKLRANEREKERLTGQIIQSKEESRWCLFFFVNLR